MSMFVPWTMPAARKMMKFHVYPQVRHCQKSYETLGIHTSSYDSCDVIFQKLIRDTSDNTAVGVLKVYGVFGLQARESMAAA